MWCRGASLAEIAAYLGVTTARAGDLIHNWRRESPDRFPYRKTEHRLARARRIIELLRTVVAEYPDPRLIEVLRWLETKRGKRRHRDGLQASDDLTSPPEIVVARLPDSVQILRAIAVMEQRLKLEIADSIRQARIPATAELTRALDDLRARLLTSDDVANLSSELGALRDMVLKATRAVEPPPAGDPNDMLTTAEAARLLRVREATLRSWRTRPGKRRLLPCVIVGNRAIRYRRADLVAFIAGGGA